MIHLTDLTPQPATPDITPLLDVVFILLIFFVVSSVFAAQGMEIDLPEAAASHSISGRIHTIQIKLDNTVLFDNTVITIRELSFKLTAIKEVAGNDSNGKIILECSPDAKVGGFIQIADTVRSAEFDGLVIATNHPAAHGMP
ncbi:MAG: biopolymer transporter ExbD [Desulfobacteraceae bacterium]|nr:biopolymer transporter ExbD [Desulfobacteraceae bacterium]